jgi:signal transduction histidine kinase
MVVFALGLALVGMIQALHQARSLTHRLMAPAEAQAARIAETALDQFEGLVSAALDAVAEHLRGDASKPWVAPRGFPRWLDGVFVWDGSQLNVLTTPSITTTSGLLGLAADRLAAFSHPMSEDPGRPEFLHDSLGESPVVLACARATDSDGRSIVIAAHLNLDRLKTYLIEPLLPPDGGLELIPVYPKANPDALRDLWSQRLLSAMRYWAIRPTEAFVREQTRAVVGQTLVYLGLTVLALATLLIAMWVLLRVVRSEMDLAQMKANFVADVSHELKTPLALIRMFGETLQSGRVTSEEKQREYYDIITRESTRLAGLIDNILDFARIEAGRKDYVLEPTNIADIVRDTYEAYRPQLDHGGFEHHLSVHGSLPMVDADRNSIAQVLINLITNAVKYSEEEHYLAIDVTEDMRRGRRGVLISVHDRGIGISPEDRAHLVDGFFRANDRRVRNKGGAGLGLALVKHIVDCHDGLLDVESRLVKGSTFRIFLPASELKADLADRADSVD